MFKIGEFSRLTLVSARMLRHYEKCGLLTPAEIDCYTGYRFYSAGQIPLLSRIVSLRDAGFSIEEIGQILPNYEDQAYLTSWVEQKTEEVQAAIHREEERLKHLAALRLATNHRKERDTMKYEIQIKSLPEEKVLSLREVIPTYQDEGMLWHKLASYVAHNRVPCRRAAEGAFATYLDPEYREQNVTVEVAMPVDALEENRDGLVYQVYPAMPQAATIRFYGPYENTGLAQEKLAAWLEEQNYEMAGQIRTMSVVTPQHTQNPEEYVTEIQVPVRKK